MDMDDKEYGEQISEATSILSVRPPSVNWWVTVRKLSTLPGQEEGRGGGAV